MKEAALDKILKRPGISYESLDGCNNKLKKDEISEIEVEIKYKGFIERQDRDIEKFKKIEHIKIPDDLDFHAIKGLSNEIKEKLTRFKPISVGQASRISGVTPVAVSLLMVYLKDGGKPKRCAA